MNSYKKYFNGLVQGLVILGFGLNMIGCSKDGGSGADAEVQTTVEVPSTTQDPNTATYKNPHRCDKIGKNCYKETFEQPVTNTSAVDVLFVVQTSNSLVPERQAIVAGIDEFIQTLPANSDFNIAVMLSHGSTSAYSGKLFQAASEPIVLKSSQMTNAQIQSYLDMKLAQVATDPDSGGGEEGLFSLFNGITTPALLAASQAQDFFRPQAALAVVFVSDRRDICAIVPAGVPAETDPVKIDARIRDCEGLTAAGLTNRLHVLKGSLPVQVSAITYVDSPAPAGNEIGYGHTDMVALNAGVAIDIANDDIASGLASIAELSGQQMEVQYEFTLKYANVDPNKLIVTVNGQQVPYTLDGNTVTITSEIPAGAVVVIAYCVKKIKKDDCDHSHHHKCKDKKNDCDRCHHHKHKHKHKWWDSHGKKGHCKPKSHNK